MNATLPEGLAGHGSHRPGSVCLECERAGDQRPLNCCGSTEGHRSDCETVRVTDDAMEATIRREYAAGHRADPVWYDHRSNIICKTCRARLVGDGTLRNPWRHRNESRATGVTA